MESLDRRTRRDDDVRSIDAPRFFDEHFPLLVERHGEMAARGYRHLNVRPLTLVIDNAPFTVREADGGLTADEGRSDDAIVVELDGALFSDLAQQLQSFNALLVGRRIRPENGTFDDLTSWDSVWLALLEGWPVVAREMAFRDSNGDPLNLSRCFTPDDDPADVAHFLREAGFLHLRGWTDPGNLRTIADDVARALPSYTRDDGRSWWATLSNGEQRCVRLQHFVEHSPATAALLRSERWGQLRSTLAGDDDLVQGPVEGNCIEALVKPIGVVKGISDVPWHRDCNFGRHAYQCAGTIVGVSVTDGRADSGLLRTVAGSHRFCMPSSWTNGRSYLPVLPLATEAGDLTVHLSCTLHEAQPPRTQERLVMYTGFSLAPVSGAVPSANKALADLRERAPHLQSQAPSPVGAKTPIAG